MKNVSFATGTDRRIRRICYLFPLLIAAGTILNAFQRWSQPEEQDYSKEEDETIVRVVIKSIQEPPSQAPTQPDLEINTGDDFRDHVNSFTEEATAINVQPLELWEEPNLLNISFNWIANNKSICLPNPNDDYTVIPILVHTSRSHFTERLVLRKILRSLGIYRNWDLRSVFLMGEVILRENPSKQEIEETEIKLKEEQEQFGDLVIGNFIDSYRNLTYKHLMGYKWVLNFCKDAPFVFKLDDDIFFDFMRWLDWFSEDVDKIKKDKDAIVPDVYCQVHRETKPFRNKSNKWYVTEEEWNEPTYPNYCNGAAYAIKVNLIKKIYAVSNSRKFFWIDDAYVTGDLLREAKKKFNFKPEIKNVWYETTVQSQTYRAMCKKGRFEDERKFKSVVFVPRGKYFERDMMCLHNKTLYDRRNTKLLN